jgi:hypothetical protein
MAAIGNSPKFRDPSVGPILKTVTEEVDVRVDNLPCSWLRIKPSQAPDSGSVHSFAINAPGSAATDMADATAAVVNLDGTNKNGPYLIRKVYITSGKDGTTFDVEALI